jgi:Putative polyhydroxyalkanoic acid system protein (PHA_gran_rgn)
MRHSVQHQLEPAKAKAMLDRALDTYRTHYTEHGVEAAWIDERTAEIGFELTGSKVDGRITVCEDRFDIDLRLPWTLLPFGKRIAHTFEQELQRWLDRA